MPTNHLYMVGHGIMSVNFYFDIGLVSISTRAIFFLEHAIPMFQLALVECS